MMEEDVGSKHPHATSNHADNDDADDGNDHADADDER